MDTQTTSEGEHFTDTQIAALLGVHPVTVRKWRTKNSQLGCIKHGPPYEFRGANVVYPKEKFRTWCSQVKLVNGVPRMNLPKSADTVAIEQQATVNEEASRVAA